MRHPARLYDFGLLLHALRERQAAGLIHRTEAPDLGLSLWSYSKTCVFDSRWDEFTMLARGLILDEAARQIVATPFPKFFNLGECPTEYIPDLPFTTTVKLDGSLIILFYHQGQWRTATKGSFTSPQALWAARKLPFYDLSWLDPTTTYLCEAIYPENRIVIPYAGTGSLHLIGAYDSTGTELSHGRLQEIARLTGMPPISVWLHSPSLADLAELARTLPPTEEGWVLRFDNGLRLKLKGDAYRSLHRAIAGITPLTVWEALRDSRNMTEWRMGVPEEFWSDFDQIHRILLGQLQYYLDLTEGAVICAADWTNPELAARLHTFPESIRDFVFAYRRKGRNHILEHKVSRPLFFNRFRPTYNRLTGYVPSTSMQRVQEESTA